MSVAAGPSLRPPAALLHQHLTTVMRLYPEMNMRFWLEKVEAELKELE